MSPKILAFNCVSKLNKNLQRNNELFCKPYSVHMPCICTHSFNKGKCNVSISKGKIVSLCTNFLKLNIFLKIYYIFRLYCKCIKFHFDMYDILLYIFDIIYLIKSDRILIAIISTIFHLNIEQLLKGLEIGFFTESIV